MELKELKWQCYTNTAKGRGDALLFEVRKADRLATKCDHSKQKVTTYSELMPTYKAAGCKGWMSWLPQKPRAKALSACRGPDRRRTHKLALRGSHLDDSLQI